MDEEAVAPGRVRRWLLRLRRWAGPGIVVALLLGNVAAMPSAWMYASTARQRMTASEVPAAPVAIVFGAGLFSGKPSPFLAGRLDVGAELYRLGKVQALLVSGDNSRKGYDEPSAMRDYLVAHGVPAHKVVLDYAGFDTWDSCVRAHRIFGIDRAIVVTQMFHLPRAVAECRAAGIVTYGVGHDSYKMQAATTEAGYVRETLASLKAMGDLVLRPKPHFLGPREPGVRQALAN